MWKLTTVQSSNTNPILTITRAKSYRLPVQPYFFRTFERNSLGIPTVRWECYTILDEFFDKNSSKSMDELPAKWNSP